MIDPKGGVPRRLAGAAYYLIRVAYSGDMAEESDPAKIAPENTTRGFQMEGGKYQPLAGCGRR